jgi:Plasmid replication region DNA-binding N-term
MTGSHSQIKPVLSAWRIKQAGKSAAGSPVPDELTETAISLVARCWALAEKKALEDAQDGRRGADLRIKELEQENTELKETLEKSELDVGQQEHQNSILIQKLGASEQVVIDLRGKIAGSAREIILLRERVADLSGGPVRNEGTSKSQKRGARTNGGNTGGTSNPA